MEVEEQSRCPHPSISSVSVYSRHAALHFAASLGPGQRRKDPKRTVFFPSLTTLVTSLLLTEGTLW